MGLALGLSNGDSKTLRAKQKSLTIHSNKGLKFVTSKDLNVSPTQIKSELNNYVLLCALKVLSTTNLVSVTMYGIAVLRY